MRHCVMTVASNMSEETVGYLCEKTKEKFGDDLVFTKVVNDEIIGGFILDIDGMIYDLSLSAQCYEMKKHLKGV